MVIRALLAKMSKALLKPIHATSSASPLNHKLNFTVEDKQVSYVKFALGKSMLAVIKHLLLLNPWKDNFSSICSVIVPGEQG